MPKVFTSKSQKTGELGEKIAAKYLESKGYQIIDQNYTRNFGEIDIVARRGQVFHFLEIKSVSRERDRLVSHETIRPEENMHPRKIEKLVRTIDYYLMEKKVSHETEWQIDLLCVYLDRENKKAQVKLLERII